MNIKIKRLFLLSILFPLILILTACNSGGGTDNITQPTLYVSIDSEISDPLVEVYDDQKLISQKSGNKTLKHNMSLLKFVSKFSYMPFEPR